MRLALVTENLALFDDDTKVSSCESWDEGCAGKSSALSLYQWACVYSSLVSV